MTAPFWVIGHRGSPVHHVENTLASFAAALGEGANAVELDVSFTQDRHGVVWHDWDPNAYKSVLRALGVEPYVGYKPVMPFGRHRKRVSGLMLPEFLEHYGYAEKRWHGKRVDLRVPTLPEFFEWGTREPRLRAAFLDLKIPPSEIQLLPGLLREIDALVARFRPSFRVVLETAELVVLAELRRLGSIHPTCFDVEPGPGFVRDLEACSAVTRAIAHGARLACPQRPRAITVRPFATHARIVERELLLQRTHNSDSPRIPVEGVLCFTINDPGEMRSLIGLGVAGIVSDKPSLLYEVAERMGKVAGWIPAENAAIPLASPNGAQLFRRGR